MNRKIILAVALLILLPFVAVAEDKYIADIRERAERGDATAQYRLGTHYYYGRGVPEDKITAFAWFNISAANENEMGIKNKESVAKQLTPGGLEVAQRLSSQMAENNPDLMNNLSRASDKR